ncbi:hypothetical protein ACFL31_02400 [Candidatus Margulisiibacteriota bacterium]
MKIKNSAGFTFIELTMAVIIAGIALYSLLTVFMNAATKNVDLESVSTALHLANTKLEIISNQSYDSISSEAQASFGGDFSSFNSLVEVDYVSAAALDTITSSNEGYKRIKVFITSGNLTSSVEIVTLVTDASNK